MANGNGNNKQVVVYRPPNPRKRNGNNKKRQITTRINTSQTSACLQGNTSNNRSVASRPTHLMGSDFVTTLRVKGTSEIKSAQDRILLKQPISASSFIGTRVTALSELWERYRWRKAEMRYVPAVPNTIACQLIAYLDTDPLDDPSTIVDAEQLLRQATAQIGSRQWNFNCPRTIPLVVRKDDQLYYTGLDKQNPRFSQQGVLYIMQVTDLLSFSGEKIETGFVSGSLYLDWMCEFTMPQINPSFGATSVKDYEIYFVSTVNIPSGANNVVFSGLDDELSYLVVPAGDMKTGSSLTDFDSEWGVAGSGANSMQFRALNTQTASGNALMDGYVPVKPTGGSITVATQTVMPSQASLDFNLFGIRLIPS